MFAARAETPEQARGKKQAAALWRAADGDAAAFEAFAKANTASDAATRDALFTRLSAALVSLEGHMHEAGRDLRMHVDLDRGPILPFDEALAAYDPGAHLTDDLFENKLAFTTLLNFPVYTLEEKLRLGSAWTRRQWAEARLADRFATRVPASVNLAIAKAQSDSAQYIASYNIWMHHLVDEKGVRLFPPKMRLLSHWNLRDELKSDYADKEHGPAKQRAIRKVMERIVDQTIPRAVLDNPSVDWNPFTNEVRKAAVKDSDAAREARRRPAPSPTRATRRFSRTFAPCGRPIPYSPTAPTFIARKFEEDRQIPEARVRKMLEDVLSSPLVPKVAALIEKRLGRKLSPVDVWYPGFRPQPAQSGAELDALVRAKYPTPEAYAKDIPNLLAKLGFSKERAEYVASRIEVHPARGSGHASGAALKGYKAYLRTRVEKDGMNYKGYNIAVHEMGHNVEQTFSLYDIDYPLLQGVPNTAFTEALAFVFQGARPRAARPREALGRRRAPRRRSTRSGARTRSRASALVDMGVWHFMYDHPEATPAELKAATLAIARDVWNRYYAPVLGEKDVTLLARLLAHDRRVPVPARLLDRPHDRVPGRAADGEGRSDRPRVRAHGEARQHRARSLDDRGHGRARRPRGASRRDGEGAFDVPLTRTREPRPPYSSGMRMPLRRDSRGAFSRLRRSPPRRQGARRRSCPFIADDYPKALAAARAEKKPIFLETWAPW